MTKLAILAGLALALAGCGGVGSSFDAADANAMCRHHGGVLAWATSSWGDSVTCGNRVAYNADKQASTDGRW